MIRIHLLRGRRLDDFHEGWAAQLNDTHPSIAVAELMRLLMDEHAVDWAQGGAAVCQAGCAPSPLGRRHRLGLERGRDRGRGGEQHRAEGGTDDPGGQSVTRVASRRHRELLRLDPGRVDFGGDPGVTEATPADRYWQTPRHLSRRLDGGHRHPAQTLEPTRLSSCRPRMTRC